MKDQAIVYLMYHELELPGRKLCQNEKGSLCYVISASNFDEQIRQLRTSGYCGLNVTDALRGDCQQPCAAITFDDGCETDLLVAAPLLKEAGFSATFYVVAGFLGRRGYLSPVQLRELSDLGFEIGCHSMTHPFLTDLGPDRLHVEIRGAKDRIEQLISKPVDHFSCPGGRWNRWIASMAREAGYSSVATSRIGTNSAATDPFCLARVAVLRGTTVAHFGRLCRAKGLFLRRGRETLLAAAKVLLGNSLYEKARGTVLGED